MNKPLLLVILFCLSVLVILSPVIYVTVVCGDYQDMDVIIEKQRNAEGECLVGMIYGDTNVEYMKIENIKYYHPKILAVGASRVAQYQSRFFNTSFYNSGVPNKRIDTYSNMIESIDNSSMPEIVIIDLDPLNFKPGWTKSHINPQKNEYSFIEILALAIKKHGPDIYSVNLFQSVSNMVGKNNNGIGYVARSTSDGYMKDGARNYGSLKNNPGKSYISVQKHIEEIELNKSSYGYCNEMDKTNLEYLDNFLMLCKEKGIHVVACIPPYSPSIYGKLLEYKNNYKYMDEIYPSCKKLFDKYEYELYDYRDVSKLEITDDGYFSDGHHGGEVVYLKMIIDMAKNGSILNKYVDIEYLSGLYENRKSNVEI